MRNAEITAYTQRLRKDRKQEKSNKEKAERLLQRAGILTKAGNVTKKYKDVIV